MYTLQSYFTICEVVKRELKKVVAGALLQSEFSLTPAGTKMPGPLNELACEIALAPLSQAAGAGGL